MTQLEKQVLERIRKEFWEEVQMNFHDEVGDGKHFYLDILSDKFVGKTRTQQSKLVYACLDDLMQTGMIHALRMKCRTP